MKEVDFANYPDAHEVGELPSENGDGHSGVEQRSEETGDSTNELDVPIETEVSLEVRGEGDPMITVRDIQAFRLFPLGEEPESSGSFVTDISGPLFVLVEQLGIAKTEVTLTSSHDLMPLLDADDGRVIRRDDRVSGSINVPTDTDVFLLLLAEGETVTIEVDGLFDPGLAIDVPDNPGNVLAFDSDSGGGLYGTNPRLNFTAPTSDDYLVVVRDFLLGAPRGYVLTVK